VIGGYAYFVATRLQYEYPDAKERMSMNKFYKLCRKRGFDVEKYNRMKEAAFNLEKDLDSLRRSPGFALRKNLPVIDEAITIVRDIKSQAVGNKTEQESVSASDLPPPNVKEPSS